MRCQKCGALLQTEQLYCHACGAEYQIVPNYEPELEWNMEKSLSGLSASIQEDSRIGKTAEMEEQTSIILPNKTKRRKGVLGLFFCAVLVIFGLSWYQTTEDHFLVQARKAKENRAWIEAASWYGKLREKAPMVMGWYLEEARMYLYGGNRDQALYLGHLALEQDPENEQIYSFLLDLYLKKEDYEQINELLQQCQNEDILQQYAIYLAKPPVVNYPEGEYTHILELELTAGFTGTIHYTLDGSTPTGEASVYREPLPMGNGIHKLKAVYINSFGIVSDVLQQEYQITADLPIAPVVLTESGIYDHAESIVVEREEGTEIYYTMDGTMPTRTSNRYQQPIPMPLGKSNFRFVAYTESGIAGEVTERGYLLNIKTGISEEEAGNFLVQEMIKKGLILDQNGALLEHYGVHRYVYRYPILVEGNHYYVFAEHYLENEIDQRTGNYFAVDVMQGKCFSMFTREDGTYHLTTILPG